MPDKNAGAGDRGQPFGPHENADETRQAQQQVANDTPVDCNPNAIMAREQMGTYIIMGKNFEAGAARRNALFDHLAYVSGVRPVPPV